jgi:hypothetical protein
MGTYVYIKKFLWTPKMVQGKLMWLQTVYEKQYHSTLIDFGPDGLASGLGVSSIVSVSSHGYVIKEERFIDSI